MVKVKICGITNLKDARAAVKAGCDALGFVFYKKSPRYIRPERAREIISRISQSVKKIGVFVNPIEKNVKNIARLAKLDMLQFHGNETPGFCRKFKGYRIIKALRIKDKFSLKAIPKYPVWAFLLDSYKKNIFGGTGKRFDWRLTKNLKTGRKKIFLSGGLDSGNVKKAIKLIKPDWVDVSTSVESRPGKKDQRALKEFIKQVGK